MALYNIQDYIENPFDQKGLDDLQIDQMQILKRKAFMSRFQGLYK